MFVSKTLSAALVGGINLLALFPMLALPFLIGGVPWDLFVGTVVTLPALLLLALALTLLASVLTSEEGASVALAAALGAGLCILPIAVHFARLRLGATPPDGWWLRLSPAYIPWKIWTGRAMRREIWSGCALTLVWSGLMFAAAAAVLRRLWREQAFGGATVGWQGAWGRWWHGGPGRRRALAARWLDLNPFVWLTARDRQLTCLAWAVVAGVIVAWCGCWTVWGSRWPSVLNLFFTFALLNAALRWVMFYAAARALAQPRRDGSFELLLTTRLEPEDIVLGGLQALNVQFCRVGRCVLALEVLGLLAALMTRRWTGSALFVYAVGAAVLLTWAWPAARGWRPSPAVIPGVVRAPAQRLGWQRAFTAMWAGLNSGRPAFAVWRSAGVRPWVWLLNLYNVYMFGFSFSGFATFPTGSPLQLKLALGVAAFLGLALILQGLANTPDPVGARLLGQFREVVREPLPDRDDPAFKHWDVGDRLRPARKVPWLLRRIG